MKDSHTVGDLIDFLTHAGDRGLMPAATAQALAVATRNVFSVLDDAERADLPLDDIDDVIRRFNNRRARDFNPTSLKEYGRRVKRAVDMYLQWKADPANFTVKTRSTSAGRKKDRVGEKAALSPGRPLPDDDDAAGLPGPGRSFAAAAGGYQTAFPVRQGQVITVSNIPYNLSVAEAERLAHFIRLLAPAE